MPISPKPAPPEPVRPAPLTAPLLSPGVLLEVAPRLLSIVEGIEKLLPGGGLGAIKSAMARELLTSVWRRTPALQLIPLDEFLHVSDELISIAVRYAKAATTGEIPATEGAR